MQTSPLICLVEDEVDLAKLMAEYLNAVISKRLYLIAAMKRIAGCSKMNLH